MDTKERICLEEEYDNDLKKIYKITRAPAGDMLELVLARKREITANTMLDLQFLGLFF